ncbi:hypothetical protein D3C79_1070380 [compost metagenome]
MPVAVATSFLPNESEVIAYRAPDKVWWAKPPMHSSAIAVYGLATRPMHAGPIMHEAPNSRTILREVNSDTLQCLWKNGLR